jgi:hypothetical protein
MELSIKISFWSNLPFHIYILPVYSFSFSLLCFFLLSPTSFFFYPSVLFHLISLLSSFCISSRSFLSLSPHSTFCTFFPLLPSNTCFLSPRSFSLSSKVLRNFLCHTPLKLPLVSGFFDSFPSFLLVCVFIIHLPLLLIFPLLHWHTCSFGSTSLSPSSPCFLLFSPALG